MSSESNRPTLEELSSVLTEGKKCVCGQYHIGNPVQYTLCAFDRASPEKRSFMLASIKGAE